MNKKYKEYAPKQEVIDNVRKVNNKLRLIVHLYRLVDVFHHLFVHVVSNLIC